MKQLFCSPFDKIKHRISLKRQRGFLLNPARFATGGAAAGDDPFWSNVVGYYRFNDPGGAARASDLSWAGKHLTASGTASILTTTPLRGSGSASIPGSGNSAFYVQNSEEQNISSGDFTIELIYRNTAAPQEFARLFQTRDGDTFAGISIVASGSGGVLQFQLYMSGNGTTFSIANGVGVTGYLINTTYHIALTRSGNDFKFFINGAIAAAFTINSTIWYELTDRTTIGGNTTSTSRSVSGLIDEVRITKGVARYTAAFTPPTLEFPLRGPIDLLFPQSVLSMNMNGRNASTFFPDLSPNKKNITASGNAAVSIVDSKFGGGCAVFDGVGDFLTVASSENFDLATIYTIEFFIKPNSLSSNFGVLHRGFYNTSAPGTWTGLAFSIRWIGAAARFYFYGTTAADEQFLDVASAFSTTEWRHIAMVRDGTTGRVFVNGVLSGTITGLNTPLGSTQTLRIGRWDFSAGNEDFNGRLDDVRIIRGTAKYSTNFTPPIAPQSISGPADASYASVSLLLDFVGPNTSTQFFDKSPNVKAVTARGNAVISTAISRFNGCSAVFDGTGDALTIPDDAGFDFGSSDFTVEITAYWLVMPASGQAHVLASQWSNTSAQAGWSLNVVNSAGTYIINFAYTTNGSTQQNTSRTLTSPLVTGTWYHIAVSRAGNTMRIFVNGVQVGADISMAGVTIFNSNSLLAIGAQTNNPATPDFVFSMNGYIGAARITKGVGRYTAGFAIPISSYPNYGA